MNDLKVFSYGKQTVRTVFVEDEPWWVLTDVCKVLGTANASKTASRLDDDEKMIITQGYSHSGLRGGAQRMIVVSESGLYSVILRSDKPEAKAFKRWVTHTVLPSLHGAGTYGSEVVETSPPVPTPVPVAVLTAPDLPDSAVLKRAELLIRASEHPALSQEEQLRLLNRAAMDLTGTGIKSVQNSDGSLRFPRAYASTASKEVE